MKIEVDIIKENEDGSAEANVHFDKEGLQALIQEGLISMLTKGIDEYRVRCEKASKSPKKRIKK